MKLTMNNLATYLKPKTRVHFVDDEVEQLDQLKSYFDSTASIIGKYSDNPNEAIEAVKQASVDVLVIDMHLAQTLSGIDFIEDARKLNADMGIILFTGYVVSNDGFARCKRAGAEIVRKQGGKAVLYDTIESLKGIPHDSPDPLPGLNVEKENRQLRGLIKPLVALLIDDLEKLETENSDIKIEVLGNLFSPRQLANEIKQLTDPGEKFLGDYLHGMTIYNRGKNKRTKI